MEKYPLISIIIPVYNVSKFLDICFSSIVEQDFESYEVIIVNDGSTDESSDVCQKWTRLHSNFKLYNKENGGVASARNYGIAKAQGDYFFFLDPDDYIAKNTLSDNYKIAVSANYDLIVFGYTKISITKSGKQVIHSKLNDLVLKSKKEVQEKLTVVLNDGGRFSVWNKLFKKELLLKNNIQFPDFKRGEDIAMMLEVFKHANSIAVNSKRYYTQEAFYSNSKYNPDEIENHLYSLNKFYYLYDDWMAIKHNKQYYVKLFILWFCHVIPNSIVLNSNFSFLDKIKKIKVLITNQNIKLHLSTISANEINGWELRLLFLLFKNNKSFLFFVVTQFKATAIQKLNSRYFRNRINSKE